MKGKDRFGGTAVRDASASVTTTSTEVPRSVASEATLSATSSGTVTRSSVTSLIVPAGAPALAGASGRSVRDLVAAVATSWPPRQAEAVPSKWGVTPRQSVEAECGLRGAGVVVSGCVDILEGRYTDEKLLLALGGPTARYVLDGHEGPYWFRVWAARGLLYAWNETAAAAVIQATADEAWRVREMAAKVIARHRVGDGIEAAVRLREDPVARVRAAGERALIVLTEARA